MADFPLAQRPKHYSGTFWAATNRGHVIYESRLELARLLFADFDRSGQRIVAQPFLLKAHVAGFPRFSSTYFGLAKCVERFDTVAPASHGAPLRLS